MAVKPTFNPVRVVLLMRNAVMLSRASILFTSAALAGVVILWSLADTYTGCSPMFHRSAYLWLFFSGGLFVTCRGFRELHDPIKGYAWLLLPASALEKTVSRILLVGPVYCIASLMAYLAASLLSEGVNALTVGRCHFWFNPLDFFIFKLMAVYIVVQAPFLAGAVYFKKHVLSKTILFLVCIVVVFGVGMLAAARIIFGEGFGGLDLNGLDFAYESGMFQGMGPGLIKTGKVIFWFVLPVVSWVICFLRHRETEL